MIVKVLKQEKGQIMAKITLAKNKEKRVEYGHPWIYRSDIENIDGLHSR